MNPGLYPLKEGNQTYNGGGWISSLQSVLEGRDSVELGLAFITHHEMSKKRLGSTCYYPIYQKPLTQLAKIKRYYGGYKHNTVREIVDRIQSVIEDFKPEIIHLFGLENPMACILGKTEIPIVVHLQGLLWPCDNAFWPVDCNRFSFLWPFSIREWVLRNGYIYAKKSIHERGRKESSLMKSVKYVMGRTGFDHQYSSLLSPSIRYYHVDEVMRSVFYEHAGKWVTNKSGRFVIVSTISDTVYKGLDLILKTAILLKAYANFDFEWRVVGVDRAHKIIRFFERLTGVNSEYVNIKYQGILSADNLCQELLSASVYVHPSYIDNSPNSVCEAQLLGVPVIATYVGGVSSLIEQEGTGFLIPANAPIEAAYRIRELHDNVVLANCISKNSSKKALLRHDKNTIVCDLMKTYSGVVRSGKK